MRELECIYDSRKEFYGKAKVQEIISKNIKSYQLFSYGTLVAQVIFKKNKTIYEYYGQFSQTTTRHQKEFFKQNGLSDKEIKELFKNEILEK